MKQVDELPTEAAVALLPIVIGAVAVHFFQGEGGWDEAYRWVAEGLLMPPAAILCVALLSVFSDMQKHPLTRLVSAGVFVQLLVIVLLFAASVQPTEDRGLSGSELFAWNVTLYGIVFVLSGIVATWRYLGARL